VHDFRNACTFLCVCSIMNACVFLEQVHIFLNSIFLGGIYNVYVDMVASDLGLG
jgi:hypothetical protein